MKICSRCQIAKDESGFTKSKNRKDGLSVYCKICKSLESKKYNTENREKCAEKLRKWREKNPEKSKEYSERDREKNKDLICARRKTPEARKKLLQGVKDWRERNKEKFLSQQKEYKEKNRLKINARFRITNSIRRKKLIRPNKCNNCGSEKGKMEAHHEDYSKPLDVRWLCFICHKQIHGKLKEIKMMKKPTKSKLGKEFDKKGPKDPKKKPIGDAMKGMERKGCSMGMKKGK